MILAALITGSQHQLEHYPNNIGLQRRIKESRGLCAMSNNKPEQSKIHDESLRPQQVVKWAMCHPGVLLLGSLAVGTILACRRSTDQPTSAERRAETEADIIDGDTPLFV